MGGWTQAITQGLGRAGAEAGTAVDSNIQTALQVIQQRLLSQEVQQRLRESDLRMKQISSPQTQYLPTPGGGTAAIQTAPFGGAPTGSPQTVIPGQTIPKTDFQAWYDATVTETGKPPSSKQIESHEQETKNPLNSILWQGVQATQDGDTDKAKKLFQLGQVVRGVQKGPASPSTMSMILAAQKGDPEAQQALRTWLQMQRSMAQARGEAFGAGRAMYNIGAYEDGDTGQIIPMSAMDAIQAIHAGKNLIPSGRLPATTAIAAQQLTSEASPALKGVRRYLSAFDDAGDRAIFARILSSNPAASPGQEKEWLGTILNQALTSNLSDNGKHLAVNLNRLNESVGRLRSVLGLPATQSMTAMTLAMVPGPATPNADFANDMLDNLEQTIGNAIAIPALGGPRNGSGGTTPPSGATIRTYNPATGKVE